MFVISQLRRRSLLWITCLIAVSCLFLTQSGCGSSRKVERIVRGRIEHKGKPVYPVAILIQDESGAGFSANVGNPQGEFVIVVESGKKYDVAIEPIESRKVTQAEIKEAAKRAEKAKAEGRELRREDTIGSVSISSNTDFPEKFYSFQTSGLVIDCTNGVPTETVVLDLK